MLKLRRTKFGRQVISIVLLTLPTLMFLFASAGVVAQNVSLAERGRNPNTGCRCRTRPSHNHAGLTLKRKLTDSSQGSTPDGNFEVEVYLFLGNKARNEGKLREAINNYNEALKLDGNEWRAHYGLGNVLFDEALLPRKLNQPAESLPERLTTLERALHAPMMKAIAEYKEAVRLSEAVKQDEQDEVAELYSDLAQAYLHIEDAHSALEWVNNALELNKTSASAVRRLGNIYFNTDKVKAITKYKEALKLEPDNALTHQALGAAYNLTNQPDLALREFEEVVRLRPNYFQGYEDLARIYEAKGQYNNAIGSYTKALKLEPTVIAARYKLALAYIKLGDKNSAREQYKALKDLKGVAPAILSDLKHKLED